MLQARSLCNLVRSFPAGPSGLNGSSGANSISGGSQPCTNGSYCDLSAQSTDSVSVDRDVDRMEDDAVDDGGVDEGRASSAGSNHAGNGARVLFGNDFLEIRFDENVNVIVLRTVQDGYDCFVCHVHGLEIDCFAGCR